MLRGDGWRRDVMPREGYAVSLDAVSSISFLYVPVYTLGYKKILVFYFPPSASIYVRWR